MSTQMSRSLLAAAGSPTPTQAAPGNLCLPALFRHLLLSVEAVCLLALIFFSFDQFLGLYIEMAWGAWVA